MHVFLTLPSQEEAVPGRGQTAEQRLASFICSSEPWLHVEITWGTFEIYPCLDYAPEACLDYSGVGAQSSEFF